MILSGKMHFIAIDRDYLYALRKECAEVQYTGRNKKDALYLGIFCTNIGQQYCIPISSPKSKHLLWKDMENDRFIIFENVRKKTLNQTSIYTDLADGYAKHILAAIDLKKMIPIKDGVWHTIDLHKTENDDIETKKYKDLLNKEYSFCLKITAEIVEKAGQLYDNQIKTGKVKKFCCDFKLLEEVCKTYVQ